MGSIRLCPSCGSGKVTEISTDSLQLDPDAECTSCGWKGQSHELMSALQPRQQGIDPQLRVAEEISRVYLQLLAKEAGKPIGLAMVNAGVIGVKDTSNLGRLIRAACMGAHRATLEEIDKIQEELHHGA